MKRTREVTKELGFSRQYLYVVLSLLKMRPAKQVIDNGKVLNYFSADQIHKLKKATGR